MGKGFCVIDGCAKKAIGRGWCSTHYSRWQRKGDPLAPSRLDWVECSEAECEKRASSQGRCLTCHRRWRYRTDEAYRAKRNTANRRWNEAHMATLLRVGRERHSRLSDEVRRTRSDRVRDGHLRRKYGITSADYEALHDAQGGVCGICKLPEMFDDPKSGRPRLLSVDHCAETGAVRGLLCFRCNRGIGQFRDDAALLTSAAAYLQTPPTSVMSA